MASRAASFLSARFDRLAHTVAMGAMNGAVSDIVFTSSGVSPFSHRAAIAPAAALALARLAVGAGQLVREERLRRRWTLRELAERAGVSPSHLQAMESGAAVSLETYARSMTALDLRPDLVATDPRRRHAPSGGQDLVHAAMGELEAGRLRGHGFSIAIDEPYPHYQFAGRADLVAWDVTERALLHIENRTRFPNLQEALGSYSAKRAYLPAILAERVGIARSGWRTVAHAIVALWSAEVIHSIRLRTETFRAACPDSVDGFDSWWAGRPPDGRGQSSTLVILDPGPTRGRRYVSMATIGSVHPRYRGYAEAAARLRDADVGRPSVSETVRPTEVSPTER
jgi:DNA-binding Xre family transcriptional regulator